MRHPFFFTLLVVTAFPTFFGEAFADDSWSQWRGPSRDGKLGASAGEWPSSLSEKNLTLAWKVNLEKGFSSPVISGGKVFSVETEDKKREVARAFELESGRELWRQEWEGAMKVPFFARKNGSWVRATPATDGDSLFVAGIRDVLVNLGVTDGKEKWRIDFVEREETQLPAFGYVSSPLIYGDHLFVQAGMAVAKLDKRSGATVWRALEDRRAMFASAFSSPVIATIQGQEQLVAQTRSTLAGLDLESGAVLWSTPVEAFRGMNILTPTVVGDQVFTATYGGGSFLFEVSKSDGKFSVEQKWRQKEIEGYMSSPLAIGDHLYFLARDKKFYCVETGTGEVHWVSDEKFGDYWSLVANGNRILALDQNGELLLIDAAPDALRILDRRKIS